MKRVFVELTRSEQMALETLLVEHLRRADRTEQYVDCSAEPCVVTRPEQLLRIVMDARPR